MSGLDAAQVLRAELSGCRVLMLTTFGRVGYLRRAMADGAAGFLLKDARASGGCSPAPASTAPWPSSRALHLSAGTTRNHLSAIMQKLGAPSRIDAIRVADEEGWL